MSHANAALTPRHRERMARLVVEDEMQITEAAARFQVTYRTAKKWAQRYAAGEPMTDRSSRPHSMPAKTPPKIVKRIVSLRLRKRIGPVQLAALTGVAPSTAHQVLTRCHLNRLRYLDRATGEVVRRYERSHPGAMLHVDVTKFGNIPDGGGWRFVGKAQGFRHRAATAGKPKNKFHNPKLGYAHVHTVIDDYSRVGYAEVHDDESAATAIGVLTRAVAWFAALGVTTERVLTDNGSSYRSHAWREACHDLGITPKRTRPYRPQTNGKIERWHRTMTDGWAYATCYTSESARRDALASWVHEYNHHRPHTAVGGKAPITRLTNLPGQHS
ncbi:MAG: IS481 family transposase [Tetrasphaera sp.]|nr:IS481 family transposase [Tetrasphaera sp.]